MPGYGEPWLSAKFSRSSTKRHGSMGLKQGFHLLICTHFTDLNKTTRTCIYQLPTNCSHIFMMHTYIYVYLYMYNYMYISYIYILYAHIILRLVCSNRVENVQYLPIPSTYTSDMVISAYVAVNFFRTSK